jgi:hypothetical protein
MPEYEPLRDATASEREVAAKICHCRPTYVWVAEHLAGGKALIVLPDLKAEGVAVGFDGHNEEVWTKPAYYPELLRAGDGYGATHQTVKMYVRAAWDGTWVPSIALPDGSSRVSEQHPYDYREAIKQSCKLADTCCKEQGLPTTTPSIQWGLTGL